MSNGHYAPDQFEPAQVAPHNREAEEALLGALLINDDAFYEAAELIQADDFFILRHSWIWQAFERLISRNQTPTYIAVCDELNLMNKLEDVGGAAYLTYLTGGNFSSAYASDYASVIKAHATRRKLISVAEFIAELARSDRSLPDIFGHAQNALMQAAPGASEAEIIDLRTAISQVFDEVESRFSDKNTPAPFMSTGLVALDDILGGGLEPGTQVILGGPSSHGKSLVAVSNIAVNLARAAIPVAVFSIEMVAKQLARRILAGESNVNVMKLKNPQRFGMTAGDWNHFVTASTTLAQFPIYLNSVSEVTLANLEAKIRLLVRLNGVRVVVIDYLQLLSTEGLGTKTSNRDQLLGMITRRLKALANDLDICIILGSQINRANTQRADKTPQVNDLRESGSIEQDADVVMFVYREWLYSPEKAHENHIKLIVAKHRDGPTGACDFMLDPGTGLLKPATRVDLMNL